MFEMWDSWRKGFDVWEDATAKYLEHWLKSPLMLGGSGMVLSAMLQMRKASHDARDRVLHELGLPTKRDHDRALHLLNQIQSRLIDLEDRLSAAEK